MEPAGSLRYSKEPATGPYPEPNYITPCIHILSLLSVKIILNIILSYAFRSHDWPLSDSNFCVYFLPVLNGAIHFPLLDHINYIC
jgi:hypothetical protein